MHFFHRRHCVLRLLPLTRPAEVGELLFREVVAFWVELTFRVPVEHAIGEILCEPRFGRLDAPFPPLGMPVVPEERGVSLDRLSHHVDPVGHRLLGNAVGGGIDVEKVLVHAEQGRFLGIQALQESELSGRCPG